MNNWAPRKLSFRWIVEQLAWADAFGSAYRHAKNKDGLTLKFWCERAAQAEANARNTANRASA